MATQTDTFSKWLNTLVEEKGYDTENIIMVDGPSGQNMMPLEIVLTAIKNTCREEKAKIKNTLVAIDFKNGDCLGFFKHLAGALAI